MAEVRRSNPDAFKKLAVNLANLGNAQAKVGWFDNAKYADGTPIAYIASIQEFGYPEGNIPPRLGMRFTAAAQRPQWRATSEALSKRVLAGKMTGHDAMEAIALVAEGALVQHMSSNPPPPLKAATLASRLRRGRGTQTLNDSGLMISSLTSRVEAV